MSDGPGATTCTGCGHADHFAGACFNMASDNDCNCMVGTPRPPATPIPIRGEPTTLPRELRHPTNADVGWRPLEGYIATVHHMPLGDIMAAMALAGFEVRVQMREKR